MKTQCARCGKTFEKTILLKKLCNDCEDEEDYEEELADEDDEAEGYNK